MQVLLFDADGVIIDPAHRFVSYLKDELHLPSQSTSEFFGGAFHNCLIGRSDLKQEIVPFLERWGWTSSVDDFLHTWFLLEHHINTRLVAVIQNLRQKGYYCGIATNQEKRRLEYINRDMGFSSLFDGIFGSADIGAVKPTLEFYARVTHHLGVRPEEISFWDDSKDNVSGALTYGWHAELYTGLDGFLRILEQDSLM